MPLVTDPQFWIDEHDSPLLSRNKGFVTLKNAEELCDRARMWLDMLDCSDIAIPPAGKVPAHLDRIYLRDAERTYVPKDEPEVNERTKKRQLEHINNLRATALELGDYHQGLGYIAAICGLFLTHEETVRLMMALHRSPKHSQGYFRGEPEAFVGDAKVFHLMLEARFPEIAKKLVANGAVPEMFAVKWFIGLCVHVLPFKQLFDFWDLYFQHGSEFVFQFGLSFMLAFEVELLAAHGTHDLMTILRVEDPKADWKFPDVILQRGEGLFDNIIEHARKIDLSMFPLEQIRKQTRAQVALNCEIARKRMAELKEDSDGIEFSDDDDCE